VGMCGSTLRGGCEKVVRRSVDVMPGLERGLRLCS
jgi:hypothetical protein